MKRTLFLTLCLAIAIYQDTARATEQAPKPDQNQIAESERMTIQPQLGMTSFNIGGAGLSSKSGSLAGANVLLPTGIHNLRFQSGLGYIQSGAEKNMFFYKFEIEISQLALPLLANWSFYQTERGTNYFLKGGLVLTQVLSAKTKSSGLFAENSETDIKDQVSKNDIMYTGGIGAGWKIFDELSVTAEFDYFKGSANTISKQSGTTDGYSLSTSLVFSI